MTFRRLTLKGISVEDFELLTKAKKKLRESKEDMLFRVAKEKIGKRIKATKEDKEEMKTRKKEERKSEKTKKSIKLLPL